MASCRPGTIDDLHATFEVFRRAIDDLARRLRLAPAANDESAEAAAQWGRLEPLMRHLSETADQFWVAEEDGRVVGYARATVRDGVQELTEFFVDPTHQSAGVGRELLARVFPQAGARRRVIVATTDERAVARYLKAGVYPRFPVCYFFGPTVTPAGPIESLVAEPMTASAQTLEIIARIDRALLDFQRDVDHQWLMRTRRGMLFRRNGQPAGYGYAGGPSSGPFAVLDGRDLPAAIGHGEADAIRAGTEFGVEVPLVNRSALEYVVRQGYQMSAFMTVMMSDVPFGNFDRYLCTSPQFFL
jgi:GNAT superfamily N-acetyltransferase